MITKGENKVNLSAPFLFDPTVSNVYVASVSANNPQLSYYMTSDLTNGPFDLSWNGTKLRRIVNDGSSWKFNIQIVTQQYIFQDIIPIGTTFYVANTYNVVFSFGKFAPKIREFPVIWSGKLIKD